LLLLLGLVLVLVLVLLVLVLLVLVLVLLVLVLLVLVLLVLALALALALVLVLVQLVMTEDNRTEEDYLDNGSPNYKSRLLGLYILHLHTMIRLKCHIRNLYKFLSFHYLKKGYQDFYIYLELMVELVAVVLQLQ
jgi:hypothetical protein